jgi:hypothetical protein
LPVAVADILLLTDEAIENNATADADVDIETFSAALTRRTREAKADVVRTKLSLAEADLTRNKELD